jgi:hypothetical protein
VRHLSQYEADVGLTGAGGAMRFWRFSIHSRRTSSRTSALLSEGWALKSIMSRLLVRGSRAQEVAPGVFVEFDAAGNPIGVEVISVRHRASTAEAQPAVAAA